MDEIINIKLKSQYTNFLILGILLLVSGIVLIVQSFYIGIAMVFLGILIVTFKKGIKFNPQKHLIKYYRQILFVESGNWKELKPIQYVAVVKVNLTQQMHALSIQGTFSSTLTKLNLIFSNNKILPILTDKKSVVLPIAEKIALGFKIDIFDNSEGKKVWIKINNRQL